MLPVDICLENIGQRFAVSEGLCARVVLVTTPAWGPTPPSEPSWAVSPSPQSGGRGDLLSHPLRYKPPLCSVLPKHDCLIPTTSPGEKRWHHNICLIWYKTDCSGRHKVYADSRTSQNDLPRPQYVNVSSTKRVSLSLKLRSQEWASPLQLCES